MAETNRNIPANSDKEKSSAEARQRVFDAAIDLLEKYPVSGPGNKMKTSYAKLQEIISLVLQNPELSDKEPDIWKTLEEELKFENKILSDFVTRVFKSDEWIQLVHLFPGTSENDFFTAADIYQENHDEEKLSYSDFFNLIKNVLPYIPDVLDACRKETGLQEITFVQFIQNENPATGKPAESLYEKCLRRNPPVLKSIIPDQYKIANSLISNSMTAKGFVNGGLLSLDPSKGHSGKYHIYAAITLDPNKYATVDGAFTKYDRRVFNGYCTLIEAGNPVFTAEMVYRAMNGLSNSEYISPNQIAAVTKSLNKQRDIDIKIDATEEFRKRGLIKDDPKATAVFEAKCLEARKVTVKVAGKEKTAYQVLSKPILYEYSESLNQIISVPSDLLTIKDETGGRISNTDNFTAIREYLLMRIEAGENTRKQKNGNKSAVTIDINTFYAEIDTNTATAKARSKAREQARLCLEYWKSINYISRYEFVKQNPKSKNSPVTKIIISR